MNNKFLLKVASIVALLFIISSCDDTDYNLDPSSEYDFNLGKLEKDTLYALSDSVVRKNYQGTLGQPKTSIGSYDGFSAGFVYVFNRFASFFSDTTKFVDSVKINFFTQNTYGSNVPDEILVDVYEFTSTKGLNNINVDTVWRDPFSYNVDLISQLSISSSDSAKSTFRLPEDLFNNWITAKKDTVSLYFYPTSLGEGIVELGSSSYTTTGSGYEPLLIVYTSDTTGAVADTIKNAFGYPAINTASIFNYDETFGTALKRESGGLIVSSGIVTTSLFYFDFSVLPDRAIYYSADLILTKDEYNDFENSSASSIFPLYAVEQEGSILTDVPISSYTLEVENGTTTLGYYKSGFCRNLIHGVKNGYFTYDWLEVANAFLTRELSVTKFYGVNASPELAPKLIVKYYNKEEEDN